MVTLLEVSIHEAAETPRFKTPRLACIPIAQIESVSEVDHVPQTINANAVRLCRIQLLSGRFFETSMSYAEVLKRLQWQLI